LIAVVKADGYGHGAVAVARIAIDAGADMLAVATLTEAAEVAPLVERPGQVLVMGGLLPAEADTVAAGGYAVGCASVELARALAATGAPLDVHVKVDTGMTRFGADPLTAADVARVVAGSSRLRLVGAWSHLAASESDTAFTREQLDRFLAAVEALPQRPPLLHIANSGAVLNHPEAVLDAVRVGIAMYGCEAPAVTEPVLSWRGRIGHVQRVPPGTPVGYGSSWRARRPSCIATVTMGYADGVHRARSNRGWCLVRGRKADLVGRVSMDSLTLDVTEIDQVAVGDAVTLIGDDGGERVTAEDVARWSETISYEVLTSIGRRVERVYRD
jgi:alanine racemase